MEIKEIMKIMWNGEKQVEIMENKCYKRIESKEGMGYKFEADW